MRPLNDFSQEAADLDWYFTTPVKATHKKYAAIQPTLYRLGLEMLTRLCVTRQAANERSSSAALQRDLPDKGLAGHARNAVQAYLQGPQMP